MKQALNDLLEHQSLNEQEAYNLMKKLVTEPTNEAHTAALLSVFIMRDISLQELKGFRNALLELSLPFKVEGDAIDMCGTGGDGKNTFNISTLASFVTAAAGGRVMKHGNYGVSSVSGSSDVMEYLGYKFTNDTDALSRQLDKTNICFLHAPLFHPALKQVAPVRRQMGIKTFFNMLGPLVNPACPSHRFTGTYNLQLARLYHYLFQQEDCHYTVVHALDGYDEISLTAGCKYYSNDEEFIFYPPDWNLPELKQEMLFGGNTIKEAADIFVRVLEAKGTEAQHAVVIANAAAALHCLQPTTLIGDCVDSATDALVSGKALKTFKRTIE
ncbi:MAG: anthranilate phosphoribosyltransferase [Bacteroidetes bacterium]|nr:anthranilate phosphoribosyltransferase [Bacteroidota bacterium]